MRYKVRSTEKELLDGENIPAEELYVNLKELNLINRYLGGYSATNKALQKIIQRKQIRSVTDIGCGGGDYIKSMSACLGNEIIFTGIDIRKECVDYASANLAQMPNKTLVCEDYKSNFASLLSNTDLVHCSLFFHHLSDDEIHEFLEQAKKARCIVLINDIHRHWLAYYSIQALTSFFSDSRLVQHDAPLSVKRSFKREELAGYAKRAGFRTIDVMWHWAFRYTLTAIP